MINADESKPADCGFDDLFGRLRGKRRIRFTPDGIAVDAGDGSDVKVKTKEGDGWQMVAVSERCKFVKKKKNGST